MRAPSAGARRYDLDWLRIGATLLLFPFHVAKVFDVLPMPVPLGKNEEIAKILSLLHWCGAVTIILLILAHLSGVIYHSFVRRDGVLQRMLPGKW